MDLSFFFENPIFLSQVFLQTTKEIEANLEVHMRLNFISLKKFNITDNIKILNTLSSLKKSKVVDVLVESMKKCQLKNVKLQNFCSMTFFYLTFLQFDVF